MANAVNCLDTEATWKMVEGVIEIPYSRFALPNPLETMIDPFLITATAMPGESGLSHSEKILSIGVLEESLSGFARNLRASENARKVMSIEVKKMINIFFKSFSFHKANDQPRSSLYHSLFQRENSWKTDFHMIKQRSIQL